MKNAKFIIIGSGWRSLYYARIAKALPERFTLAAMLCRTEEKAELIHGKYGIPTTTSVEKCAAMKPDFVVVAVSKSAVAPVAVEWIRKGFPVLAETSAAFEKEDLCEFWRLQQEEGAKLLIAEQYPRYPIYGAMLRLLLEGWIGDPYSATVSLAHDYHGAGLLRAFLGVGMTPFRVTGKRFLFPTTETLTRYELYTDGRIADKKRNVAILEFENGKMAVHDFDSEQYHSPIRKNYVDIRGCRGELQNQRLYYLNENYLAREGEMKVSVRIVETEDENPNLHRFEEITQIECGGRLLYEPPFGLCGLAQDETAIALVMSDMAAWVLEEKIPFYPLAEALQDSYMSILWKKAISSGAVMESEKMPWHVSPV